MFPVDFYQHFLKSENSTKIPPPVGLRTLQCSLKEETSVLSPVLLLDFTGEDPTILTYAQIPIFQNRYYFVRDWVNVRGNLWEAHLSVDVLASWKSTIADTEQFVERAQTQSDLKIPDALYAGTSTVTTNQNMIDSPWRSNNVDFVVEILSSGTSEFYEFTSGQLHAFFGAIFSDAYAENIYPGWADAYPQLKAELNPLQYIGSVRAYPVGLPIDGNVDHLWVGWGRVEVGAGIMPTGAIAAGSYQISAPSHPQGSAYPFVKASPYSEYELYFPPFGVMPLDAGVIANDPVVRCVMRIDIATGGGKLLVFGGSPEILLGTAEAKIGVDIRIGQTFNTGYGAGNLITDATGILANLATGNGVGLIQGTMNTIENFLGNMTPKQRSTGSNSGWAGFSGEIVTTGRFQRVKAPDIGRVGNLLYARKMIKELGGFIQTSNAHVETFGMVTEDRRIESLMNGGFYYE